MPDRSRSDENGAVMIAEDQGAFAVSAVFGDREATRKAIERTMFRVQLRSSLAARDQPIGPGELMALHREIFGEGFPEEAGRQRTTDIDIRGDPCVPAGWIGERLAQITHDLNAEIGDIEHAKTEDEAHFHSQVACAAVFHARLEHVHPFIDGNGRTGRALLNIMLRRFTLRPIELRTQDDYAAVLRRAIEGEPGRLIALVEGLIDQENARLIRRAQRRMR
jgi:Fic family protein